MCSIAMASLCANIVVGLVTTAIADLPLIRTALVWQNGQLSSISISGIDLPSMNIGPKHAPVLEGRWAIEETTNASGRPTTPCPLLIALPVPVLNTGLLRRRPIPECRL